RGRMRHRDVARGLAFAALAGSWEPAAMAAHFAAALERAEERWMRDLARRICREHSAPPSDFDVLATRIAAHRGLRRVWLEARGAAEPGGAPAVHVRRWLLPAARSRAGEAAAAPGRLRLRGRALGAGPRARARRAPRRGAARPPELLRVGSGGARARAVPLPRLPSRDRGAPHRHRRHAHAERRDRGAP